MNRDFRRSNSPRTAPAWPQVGADAHREDAMAAAERLASLLGLRLGERVHGGSSGSLILKAERADGSTVAVKIDEPARLCLAEVAALAAVDVCPPLVHADMHSDVAVTAWIEGVTPRRGEPLETTEQISELLGRLRLAIPPEDTLTLDDVVLGLLLATVAGDHRLGDASPIDIDALRSDSDRLLNAPYRSVLLHGDLTTNNVILAEDRAWAIDPRPHSGPVEWDAATWCLWACTTDTLEDHVDMLVRLVPGLDRVLLATSLRFQAGTFLTYRAEAGLDLPEDVVAMARFDLPTDEEDAR